MDIHQGRNSGKSILRLFVGGLMGGVGVLFAGKQTLSSVEYPVGLARHNRAVPLADLIQKKGAYL